MFEPSEPGGDQSEEGGVAFALEEQEAGDFFFHAEFAPVGEALVGGAGEGVLGAEGDEFLVFHFQDAGGEVVAECVGEAEGFFVGGGGLDLGGEVAEEGLEDLGGVGVEVGEGLGFELVGEGGELGVKGVVAGHGLVW